MGQAGKWTPEEKQYLKENWGNVSIGTMMKKLGRPKNGIMAMKQRLGLGAFLDSGDYVTWNQLLHAAGSGSGGYKNQSWIAKREFPVHTKKVGSKSFRIVYIDEFWEWAEKNMDMLDFSRMEENILGAEPEWAREKRRRDFENSGKYIKTPWTPAEDSRLSRLVRQQRHTYDELSKILRRTNGAVQKRICDLGLRDRPVKADNHTRWTDEEFLTLGELIKTGYRYELIAEKLGKSAKAVRGRVYAVYLTENLDRARQLMGHGNWGDGRPERKIKHWNVMDAQERIEARDLMGRLASVLHGEFKRQLNRTEWGEFFQKDMCRNFCGACLKTPGCDECADFARTEPQICRICGKTFYERKTNNFCQSCRDMRRRQYLRKQSVLGK